MNAIRGLGLSENTLVVFTSDNGPWTVQKLNGGTGGLFQQGKGTTWEGGLRMVSGERERERREEEEERGREWLLIILNVQPAIAWWPGVIPPNSVSHELFSTMDLFTTLYVTLIIISQQQQKKTNTTKSKLILFTVSPWRMWRYLRIE